MKVRFKYILLISLTTCCILVSVADFLSAQQRSGRPPISGNNRKTTGEKTEREPNPDFPGLHNGNIILGSPTCNSIEASIFLEKGYEGFIEYSTEHGKYPHKTTVISSLSSDPLEISLSKLKKNTNYFYRLNIRKTGETEFKKLPESWFSTCKNPASTFSFAIQGDSHPERAGKMFNTRLYTRTIEEVSDKKPDFYLLMGDDFSVDRLMTSNRISKENVESIYKSQRFYLGNPGKNPPLFLVNGNHEQAAKYLLDGTPENIAVLAARARNKFFPLPSPDRFYSGDRDTMQYIGFLKDYYSFEWGNALFVVIDPYWHSNVPVDNQPGNRGIKMQKNQWDLTLGETQYKWLKQTLETSKAGFKFVFAHHVNGTGRGGTERAKYFEWGGYGQNGEWQFDRNRPGWDLPVHQLMVKNNVTIFFQGHDHLFARQELDGVVYQTVPNPADDTYTAFNKESYISGDILPNSGFLYIKVAPVEVKVEYVRTYLNDNQTISGENKKPYFYTIKIKNQNNKS
jgi:hypothetical protein